jgi:lysophospholipase L1-like esterase
MFRRRAFAIGGAAVAITAAAVALALTTTLAAPAAARPAAPTPVATQPRLLVIGASYTAGWGATNVDLDYAHQLGDELRWPTRISAVPGAGYLSPGRNGHGTFVQQIHALPAGLRPELVIIQGGRNDGGRNLTQEYAAVRRTIQAARARFGDPTIILLGNIPAHLPLDRASLATNTVLARAAASERVRFINPIAEHWMTAANLPGFRSNVPGHPNDAGHAYIAERLFGDLNIHGDGSAAA